MRPIALITGAARNTGLAIAERFAQDGYDLCITSRSEDEAKYTAQKLMKAYPELKVLGIGMQQQIPQSIDEAFSKITNTFGRLDAYIANAADLAAGYSIFNTTLEKWNDVIQTNLTGPFLCCQHCLPLMKNGGSIVFISSVQAKGAVTGRVAYSASKAGLGGLMRTMALETAHLGIRVNSIIAGAIWSDRWAAQTDEETYERRKKYPAGRESATAEIANAVAFLCNEKSATITGTELTVDSGISLCLLPYDKEWNSK